MIDVVAVEAGFPVFRDAIPKRISVSLVQFFGSGLTLACTVHNKAPHSPPTVADRNRQHGR